MSNFYIYQNVVTISSSTTLDSQTFIHVVSNNNSSTITNEGTINGIKLTDGGSVTNGQGGLIVSLYPAVNVYNLPGTIVNYGRIATEYGIVLRAGGMITNAATGTISSLYSAFYVGGQGGTVINNGFISASPVGNSSISGTLINAGTFNIGISLNFIGTGNNLLLMEPTGTITSPLSSTVVASRAAQSNRLELAPGNGTIAAIGQTFFGFGTIQVDPRRNGL